MTGAGFNQFASAASTQSHMIIRFRLPVLRPRLGEHLPKAAIHGWALFESLNFRDAAIADIKYRVPILDSAKGSDKKVLPE